MNATETVFTYHDRTKHQLYRYVAGPETLDWDAQPNPFREYPGAPRVTLPLSADALTTTFAQLYAPPGVVSPQPFSIDSLGALLELSFGLSAWKEYGPDRWALRCNPSSGNLHPTEVYVVSHHVPHLPNGARIDARNADGNNALWFACVGEHHDMIARLLELGIDIDNQNDNGATCLMYASSTGKDEVVQTLLAHGANPALKSLDVAAAPYSHQPYTCVDLT